MRHAEVAVLLMLPFLLSGCGSDIFGKLISQKLKEPAALQCVPNPATTQATSTTKILEANALVETLRWERGSKVYYQGRTAGGALSPKRIFDLTMKPQQALSEWVQQEDVIIPEGTPLVAAVIENCENPRAAKRIKYYDYSTEQAFSLTELNQIAENDECLVSLAEGITYHTLATTNDPRFNDQTHHTAIRSSLAYDTFYDSSTGINSDVVIAIIDSGVDLDHQDLSSNTWVNTKEIPDNARDDDCNGYVDDYEGWNFVSQTGDPRPQQWMYDADEDGDEEAIDGSEHGTHVAGLAAARWNNMLGGTGVMGLRSKIMALNVFGDSPEGQTSRLNNAIRYAADNGANVINLSVGGCTRDVNTRDAIQYAVSKGVFVVTAAGNDGREISNLEADAYNSCDTGTNKIFQTPASFSAEINGLVTVASTEDSPTSGQYEHSAFTNYSTSLVEIAAPGSHPPGTSGMLSTYPDNKYERSQGTSMSSPLVAGAAGLAYSFAKKKGFTISPAKLEQLLVAAARTEAPLNSKVKNGKMLDLKSLADELSNNTNTYK